MSASLVGSEMCIRDRPSTSRSLAECSPASSGRWQTPLRLCSSATSTRSDSTWAQRRPAVPWGLASLRSSWRPTAAAGARRRATSLTGWRQA
eukprot:13643367-Alexandrium_andersonii.AAC.1